MRGSAKISLPLDQHCSATSRVIDVKEKGEMHLSDTVE